MQNTKDYWNKKDYYKALAERNTTYMDSVYSKKIQECISKSKIYSPNSRFLPKEHSVSTNIIVDAKDSVGAIFEHSEGKTAVLNFSSYVSPGGMFLEGSCAQEESLCHSSFLYNVLRDFDNPFYKENLKNRNYGLYTNRAIYTPDVMFFAKDDTICCDVITCASPNYACSKYGRITKESNTNALESRIKFVLDIAKENNIDTLILGAYGCGVFCQNPEEVASIFKKYLKEINFSKVVLAIPNGNNGNLKAFIKVFGG